MKEQFIPYELAVKLKELGFDENCLGYYRNPDIFKLFNLEKYKGVNQDIEKVGYIKAPLWQQAFDWFREKYNLYYSILPNGDVIIQQHDKTHPIYKGSKNGIPLLCETYEEARLECLKKLIEIVENE